MNTTVSYLRTFAAGAAPLTRGLWFALVIVAALPPAHADNHVQQPVDRHPDKAEAHADGAGKLVGRMLENLGGRDVWASARSVFTVERARYPVYGDGIIASHWLDLEAPGERVEMLGSSVDIAWGWRQSAGWFRRGDDIRDFDADELIDRQSAWKNDLFRVLQRLASNDPTLRAQAVEKGALMIRENDSPVAMLWLTRDGDLYRWKRLGAKEVTMVFGSLQDFGNVSFPDWGTSTTGEWSAYFTQVHASPKPFLSNTSVRHPNVRHPDWQGGALHPDSCEPR